MSRGEEAERIYRRSRQYKKQQKGLQEWRDYWKKAGPIRFAEEVLICVELTPEYPNWKQLEKEEWCEGCKKKHSNFQLNGSPYHLILSDEQKKFLTDIWTGGVDLAIVSAGRGAGKTLVLGIYDTWLLVCFDHVEISALAGSSKQSKRIQKYIEFWMDTVPRVKECIPRLLRGPEPRCVSAFGGEINFLPCSTQSVRGPHVPYVQIDEACVAEESSEEGRNAVDAIWWQIVGKRTGKVIMTSTTHYIFGKFYEYLTMPKRYGFHVYVWSIVKHISGKPSEAIYKDRNPDHWRPNVWWVKQSDIEKLRRKSSDDEWLCEACGRPSMASGAVFDRNDLKIFECKLCEECEPYKWGHCKLIEKFKLGDESNPIKYITDRKAGFDYGKTAPSALTIAGRKGQMIFVLYNNELKGVRTEELLRWITDELKRFDVYTFIPDPSIAGQEVSRRMDDLGYAVYMIGEAEKDERVFLVRRIIERHAIIVPKAFWHLIESCRKLSWDKRGKIRKLNDHSFDTLQYVTVGWDDVILEGIGAGGIFEELLGKRVASSPYGKDDYFTGVPDIW